MGFKSLILRIGMALPGQGTRRTSDGIIIVRPAKGPDGLLQDDDLLRYITPAQRAAQGWCFMLPFLLIPLELIFYFTVFGFRPGVRIPVDWDNPMHVAAFWSFMLVFALVSLCFFVIFRIGSIVDSQIYLPDGD